MPRLNHVAIVVEDLETALPFFRDLLGLPLDRVADVPAEEVRVAFFPMEGGEIELVQPTNSESGVARFLARRGPGLHHICLEVEDLEGALERLRAAGVQLIHEAPLTGQGGTRYAFIHPKSAFGVLVELYERPRAGS
ncbi:methylmalonyl-CoA epimerase [Thermoflexus sp.]|uniref:methylmalonyl-CoA epimerase n=1 Tax=Thermoflexus sp. TaxID=1969742 RepID=UPI0025EDB0B6|nr:methylmalonyl-CoA epimerase [Thermoflexus sp.]MDW8181738.1 methylmalonyl-CoA epimerase [Anaerolineae bacterium]MCS6965072.1 methylmalonyl-CoA epimerase [Thermoflexus sp.]MCS7352275.1 methylmalonyl-CoA epimerase [Thermoflexus sp.]MCX7689388.1 methylmalonyl-CoA epimerase [Thermoflexus sp.]MDW8186117.1 methylmalonyl-CoA epimerase [Anaerolineae bacterium]